MLRSHNILLVSSVISLIVVSACSPRQSVTQAMTQKSNTNIIGSNGEPLYQTSVLPTNNAPIASQQLAATMSPVANINNQLPAVDYMATGSINAEAQQKPMAIANYNNAYSAIPSVPAQSQNAYSPKAETAYRIQTGDTIYSIGRKFNVHPGEIIARNNILNPN
jgi:LysM repeat protein